jgi:S-adenosylmethionine:tRNA ribosyltransferase-isomerase
VTLVGRLGTHWLVRPQSPGSAAELLATFGRMPLPPYIRKGRDEPGDGDRYQTVYAKTVGSVAAPTAGLHFTPTLLTALATAGVAISRVTLHVGLGTFAPVTAADPTAHAIHAEWCDIDERTVDEIRATKRGGGRVIAVGTTTVRTLESAAHEGELRPFRGETDLFIHPPYAPRMVDGLMTNFHLPRTTLLLLVQAFAGPARLQAAYAAAIRERYRFYSYGDAMLVA